MGVKEDVAWEKKSSKGEKSDLFNVEYGMLVI